MILNTKKLLKKLLDKITGKQLKHNYYLLDVCQKYEATKVRDLFNSHRISNENLAQYVVRVGVENNSLDIMTIAFEYDECINVYESAMLFWFCEKGNTGIVKSLIERGADIHARNGEAIIVASLNSHTDIVKLLIEHGADVHINDDAPLRYAASKTNLDIIKMFVERGAKIYARNNEAIECASAAGNTEIVKYLLDNRTVLNTNFNNSIMKASIYRHYDVVKLLCEHGATVDKTINVFLADDKVKIKVRAIYDSVQAHKEKELISSELKELLPFMTKNTAISTRKRL